ncbi:Gfo/Idh/MocA family oxidoreductase [Streptomyces canus]|uniref:Gfo/Idh/MocA family protein n=1 Tax=Streptomyces canus TaxID=58343 RepID=UPI0033DA3136
MTRFRVLAVGAGMAVDFWLPPLCARKDVEIVGIVEIEAGRERAEAALTKYELACGVYTDLSEAIAQTGANLVANITPPLVHRQVAETALYAGCDVLGEKPLAESLEDAQAIVDAARAAGRQYVVMQNRRYAPGLRALRAGIAAGLIGRPTFVTSDMFLAPHHYGGFREEEMASPLLLDMAIHTFDQARYLIGSNPVAVTCHEFNPESSWYAGNAAATCHFEFANGTVFSYRGCWVSEGCTTSFDSAWRVTGTEGNALWDGVGQPHAEVAVRTSEETYFLPTKAVAWPEAAQARDFTHHAEAIDAMLDTLAADDIPETDCSDNLTSLLMTFAAIESARSGRTVRLDELTDSNRM